MAVVVAFVVFSIFQITGLEGYLEFAVDNISETFISALKHRQTSAFTVPADPCVVDSRTANYELVPERLIIPSVGIDLAVVSVPLKWGTWHVNNNVANYAEGTSLINPTQGNVGIYGHDLPSALTKIKEIRPGNEIILIAGEFLVKYGAAEELVVEPNKIDVFYPTDEPTLTLATCDGKFSEKRFVNRAKLKSIEHLECHEEIN